MVDTDLKHDIGEFSNAIVMKKIIYDFSKDAGAIGVLVMAQMKQAMILHRTYIKSLVAVTSGGSPTIDVGVTGDTNAILVDEVPANLTLGDFVKGDAASNGILMAADDEILLEIKVAALTAGKIEVVLVMSTY